MSAPLIASSRAPSKTGVAVFVPGSASAAPMLLSRSCQLPLPSIFQPDLAIQPVFDFRFHRPVEHRRGEVEAERVRRPPEMRLENLSDVHT